MNRVKQARGGGPVSFVLVHGRHGGQHRLRRDQSPEEPTLSGAWVGEEKIPIEGLQVVAVTPRTVRFRFQEVEFVRGLDRP